MIGDNFQANDLRTVTVAFGALFNNITLIKNDSNGNELKRIKVPLGYGSREKYIALLAVDPDLKRGVGLQLPRMAFEMVGMNYDRSRRQQQMLQNSSVLGSDSTRLISQYVPVPYDLTFNLHILSRELDDGLQLIGMILPYFQPDYTISVIFESSLGKVGTKDVPIILVATEFNDTTEGAADQVRLLSWTLSFNVKSYIYGPIRHQGQILHVYVDYYDDTSTTKQIIVNGNYLTANITRGSNVIIMSANAQSVLSANDIVKVNETLVSVKTISGNAVTGNVIMTTSLHGLEVNRFIGSNNIIATYSANVVPNTALITDNYTISEIFRDY